MTTYTKIKSQADRVLDHLKEGHTITSPEAIRFMGITRISARIWELKKQGHQIVRDDIKFSDRHGNKGTIGRWRLASVVDTPQLSLGDM
jgi:hypothetical protein